MFQSKLPLWMSSKLEEAQKTFYNSLISKMDECEKELMSYWKSFGKIDDADDENIKRAIDSCVYLMEFIKEVTSGTGKLPWEIRWDFNDNFVRKWVNRLSLLLLSIHNSSGDARLYSAVYSVASAFQDFLDKSKSSNLIISEPKSGCDKVKEAIGNILKKSDLSGGSNKNDSVNSKTNKKKNNSNSDGGFPWKKILVVSSLVILIFLSLLGAFLFLFRLKRNSYRRKMERFIRS